MSHEILLVIIVLVLLFGPAKIPALGKSMGEAIRGFKKGLSESDEKPVQQITEGPSEAQRVHSEPQSHKDKLHS